MHLLDLIGQQDSRRYEAIRCDIASRLRHACSYLSDEEFAVLVDKLVKIQLRGERKHS